MNDDKKKPEIDILTLYRNYLCALQERKENGTKYGDTDNMISFYEKHLNLKSKKMVNKKKK